MPTKKTDPKTKAKVKKQFYDNLISHRVIKDFMIQRGCPQGDGTDGPGFTFSYEINIIALDLDKNELPRGLSRGSSF